MEESQPIQSAPSPAAGTSPFKLGTVSFLAGVLLFFLPFVNIKCGNETIKEVKGFELATGFKVDNKSMDKTIFGNMGGDETNIKSEKKEPNMFAVAALGLGIIGLVISFATKSRSVIAAIFGVLASVALIALMIDIKGDSHLGKAAKTNDSLDGFNANFGDDIIRAEFTPWFYITIILFLLAAFLCWQGTKKKAM